MSGFSFYPHQVDTIALGVENGVRQQEYYSFGIGNDDTASNARFYLNAKTGVYIGCKKDVCNIDELKRKLKFMKGESLFDKKIKNNANTKQEQTENSLYREMQKEVTKQHNKLAKFVMEMFQDLTWMHYSGPDDRATQLSYLTLEEGFRILKKPIRDLWDVYSILIDMKYDTGLIKTSLKQDAEVEQMEINHEVQAFEGKSTVNAIEPVKKKRRGKKKAEKAI